LLPVTGHKDDGEVVTTEQSCSSVATENSRAPAPVRSCGRSSPESFSHSARSAGSEYESEHEARAAGPGQAEWVIEVHAASPHLQAKWTPLMPRCVVTRGADGEWPHCMIVGGDSVQDEVKKLGRCPAWLVIDGGALHKSTANIMESTWMYQQWGCHGAVSVWGLHIRDSHVLRRYLSVSELIDPVEREILRQIRKAATTMDGARFKSGVKEDDFDIDRVRAAISARPSELWGRTLGASEWAMRTFPPWPKEPTTQPLPPGDPELLGVEVPDRPSPAEMIEREADLVAWVAEGQTWEGGLLPPARRRAQQFHNVNRQSNEATARAAADGRVKKFGRVEDLKIAQDELRPGARGRQWVWDEDGKCSEQTLVSVTERVQFNPDNVRAAAALVGFEDLRALQQLCETGTTHGTSEFRWDSYACGNHQGGSTHHAAVTKMFKEKCAEDHWVSGPSPSIRRLPFGVVPCNGSEARPADDQIPLMLNDEPYERKVRGTWNGSAPHDGSDPNSFCHLPPELNAGWVTINDMTEATCVLLSIGVPVVFFKLDLRRAYTQLFMQSTQWWRQCVYWNWMDDEQKMQGGFFTDGRTMWGMRASGSIFYRTITTLTILYVSRQLEDEWAPHVQCNTTKEWMQRRRAAGFSAVDIMGCFVQSFLDDTWAFVASSCQADVDLFHAIIMAAFAYLGWNLSMSKFEEEGQPKDHGIIVGHCIQLDPPTRGIQDAKKVRLRHFGEEWMKSDEWVREDLVSWLGLAQFARNDVYRRWNLRPLYQVAHSGDGASKLVRPSARAKQCVSKVLVSLDERRSLLHRPTMWDIPSLPIMEMCPNGDASQTHGYGGSMLIDGVLQYFYGVWSAELKERRVNIAVLEAWVMIMIAATWGSLFTGRKMIFRTDSAAACFCLNKLWSKSEAMAVIVDVWEDLQYAYAFEAIVVHCSGKENRLADICSRRKSENMQSALLEVLGERGLEGVPCQEVQMQKTAEGVNVWVEDAVMHHSQ
jgi:hypothetical protein